MIYSRVTLATLEAGTPTGLPTELQGLDLVTLANLPAALDPVPEQFEDVGFWPADLLPVEFDARKKVATGEFAVTLDAEAKRVSATPILRDLTAEEIAALPSVPEPRPTTLGRLQFIVLAQSAGGMTDAMLVEAKDNPAFAAFWIKYQMAEAVERDDPITRGSLDALAAGGYLPKGKAAVIEAWPTV
ncbi:hypothetical protein [Aureimonas sp. SK2]|uniref:hypothetical protein n=1 Tax=Aureimonas sp. SK2 TaxID=3015992 RepID=UPI002444A3D0|nr:hypothetical protein [Aureimonas sp. SK2]